LTPLVKCQDSTPFLSATPFLSQSKGEEETRWRRRADAEETSRVIESLVAQEADRRVAIWLRVHLG